MDINVGNDADIGNLADVMDDVSRPSSNASSNQRGPSVVCTGSAVSQRMWVHITTSYAPYEPEMFCTSTWSCASPKFLWIIYICCSLRTPSNAPSGAAKRATVLCEANVTADHWGIEHLSNSPEMFVDLGLCSLIEETVEEEALESVPRMWVDRMVLLFSWSVCTGHEFWWKIPVPPLFP